MRRACLILVALLLAPQLAAAVTHDVGASIWTISGNDISLRYTFPRTLAARLIAPGRPAPSIETIARHILPAVTVQRHGVTCDSVDQGYDLGRIDTRYVGADLFSFEILFRCPDNTGTLVLRNAAFFDLSPGQIGIANIRVLGLPPATRLITAGHASISIGAGRAPAPSRLTAYAALGLWQALSSIVCWCAAFGLLLLIRDRRELAVLGGALLAGLVIAAAGSAGGWFLQPEAVQVFRGFLVVLVGALLAARRSGRPNSTALGLLIVVGMAAAALAALGHQNAALCLAGAGVFGAACVCLQGEERIARWLPVAPAVLLGAVQGFSLASMFAPLHAVVSIGTAQLFACNGGTALGIAAICAVLFATRLLPRRLAQLADAPVCTDLVAAGFAAVGAFSMLVM